MSRVSSPIKWHGGKYYLAKKIIELMPPRAKNSNKTSPAGDGWVHYCEPYFGGGQVLFAMDPTGISEVIGDIQENLMAFWAVLADASLFEQFVRRMAVVPVSEKLFNQCKQSQAASPLDKATELFILCRQSRQALCKSFVTLSKTRTRSGMNEQASSWLSAIGGLPDVHERLRRVVIRCVPALTLIQQEDSAHTLFYLDPPYLAETRKSKKAYAHEMSVDEHKQLLDVIAKIQGRFLLSGYRSDLYDQYATTNGWRRVDIEVDLKSSSRTVEGKKEIRTESVWMNYGEQA